ncbi:MAG TPA: hypothetical protein VIL04_06275 [Solirubrobacterales bacterium]|jgi:hypothetical protein
MRPVLVLIAALLAGGAPIAACGGGGGEEVRYRNAAIIEALDLSETERGYAIGGDPFCEVRSKLLNGPSEVQTALDGRDRKFVVTAPNGEVGVQGIAPFLPECRAAAKRGLRKLTRD